MKIVPNAPLFRDPIYDGAADPTVIWNEKKKQWWLFYTNRRAWGPNYGNTYMHGTDIGIAVSSDEGRTWDYAGTAQGLEFEPGRNTFWAPEVIEYQGIYHMYVSYVSGVPADWNRKRRIVHYTSTDLWNWEFRSVLSLSSDRVIDACVIQLPDGRWKMWYKDEGHESRTFCAYSNDLYEWIPGDGEILDCEHEGPNVFWFHEKYWMITDPWDGLGVYVSDDASSWKRCPNILKDAGSRADDGTPGAHGDVVIHKDHAYIFYFTHPQRKSALQTGKRNLLEEYEWNRSSIQVAELKEAQGRLICDRDHVELDLAH